MAYFPAFISRVSVPVPRVNNPECSPYVNVPALSDWHRSGRLIWWLWRDLIYIFVSPFGVLRGQPEVGEGLTSTWTAMGCFLMTWF